MRTKIRQLLGMQQVSGPPVALFLAWPAACSLLVSRFVWRRAIYLMDGLALRPREQNFSQSIARMNC